MLFRQMEFVRERDTALFAALPDVPAVFLLRAEAGGEPYVSKTANLRRRLTRLLSPQEERSKRLNLRDRCRTIEFTLTGSDFESGFLLYKVLRAEFPENYRERLNLRFAPLIKLNLENEYPRAYVTRRISKLRGPSRYYGPFPSRARAEKFLNNALDFFKVRRCDFELHPDPAFPGCIYSEMKMCLAPCFKGCTDEQYRSEVSRVKEFLNSTGQSLLRELGSAREKASEDLQFEAAAGIHTRIEKVRSVLGASMLPEIVRPIDQLKAVVVQRAAERNAVALFKIENGMISNQVPFYVEEKNCTATTSANHSSQKKTPPRSMESRIQECLQEIAAPGPASATELNEHLALLKRWYYRSHRAGEIFLADDRGEIPLRSIVRGVGRVLKGEKLEADPAESAAREYWLARAREQSK